MVQAQRRDLTTNAPGLDDGGLGIGGALFPGQGQLFMAPPGKKRRRNANKKNKFNPAERPGESDVKYMLQVR